MRQKKILLREDEMPTQWYNICPDIPNGLQPPLDPGTMEPMAPEKLAAVFPMGLLEQEMSPNRWIDIPEEVLEVYQIWRPAPLVRAYKLEQALGTKAKIYDTRKTLPGWRLLEKYAVRCGGGFNHRIGLYDGIMIKDNHFIEFGDCIEKHLSQLVQEAREVKHVKFVAVEVDHVDDQLNHVLAVPGVDIVLLDNMGQWQLQHAVEMRNEICGQSKKPLLEASGGITLDNIGVVASTGIDRIAVGAITHSATAVDIALDR